MSGVGTGTTVSFGANDSEVTSISFSGSDIKISEITKLDSNEKEYLASDFVNYGDCKIDGNLTGERLSLLKGDIVSVSIAKQDFFEVEFDAIVKSFSTDIKLESIMTFSATLKIIKKPLYNN